MDQKIDLVKGKRYSR